MRAMVPRTLVYRRRVINHAGSGRAPGSVMYYDAATGRTLELRFAQIAEAGPLFAYADIANDSTLPQVRLDQARLNGRPARVGQVFIVGPIERLPSGPRAECAWPVRVVTKDSSLSARNATKRSVRKVGTITCVRGLTWGFVTPFDGGRNAFVHSSQLNGVRLAVGQRVSYEEVEASQGPMAIKVRGL